MGANGAKGVLEELHCNWIIIRYRLNEAIVLWGEKSAQRARNYRRGINAGLKRGKKHAESDRVKN